MSSKIPIFFLGATGYIGGSVLARLLAHPHASSYDITALVRDAEKAKKLESFGVKTVLGSITDAAQMQQLAEQAHVVFSCANCDDDVAAGYVLAGLKKRYATLGDVPVVIHTSGTGELLVGHDTKGMAATDTIYDDSNSEQMKNIPITAFHRKVTVAYVGADTEGYIKAYIILPGATYGVVSAPMVDAGIQYARSRALPLVIRPCLERGQAGVIGKGLALWVNVQVDDLADLFFLLWDAIISNQEAVGHGWEGFYFGVGGEHAWYEVAKEVGRRMVSLGLSTSDEPTTFTEEELAKYYPAGFDIYFGSNSRGRANNSRSLGWKPKHATKDMLETVKEEVENMLNLRRK